MVRGLLPAIGVVSCIAGIALAQISVEPPAAATSIAPSVTPATPTTTDTATTLRSAQSILQDIVHDQGAPGTTEPTATTGPALNADGLLREGQLIQERSGHLKKDESGNTVFVFDDRDTPKYPAMNVIPSRRLERMEDVAFAEGRSGADTTFRITAEVTQFAGKNYLYIKPNGIPLPKPPAATTAASAPATAPIRFVDVVAPNTPVTVLLPETSIITGRVVSFVHDMKTGAELVSFYADGKQMFDPPMGLIPCKSLAVLEEMSGMGTKPIKFRLSGEVTQYRGKNFLYVKTAWVVDDHNQGIGHFEPGSSTPPVKQKRFGE